MANRTPIDIFLDGLEWKPIEGIEPSSDMPYATHEGVLHIGDSSLKVYQLNNGQRVIDQEDVINFFKGE